MLGENDGGRIIFLKDEQLCPKSIYTSDNIFLKGKWDPTGFRMRKQPWSNGVVHKEDLGLILSVKKEMEEPEWNWKWRK
jgi:hypothetical protein